MNNKNRSITQVSSTKNIFLSTTFWAATIAAIAAIAPIIGEAYDNRRISGEKVADIIVIMSGAALTVIGRVQAKTVIHTPRGLPGANKEASTKS